MRLKQLVLMGGLMALFTHTHTQAQQPKWVVNNSIVTPTTGQVVSNPLGNTANHSQNAIWDQNGNLKIYAEDGFIYNSTGLQLVPDPALSPWIPNPNHDGHSEFVFVPIPGECDKFYSFSIDEIIDGSEAEFLSVSGLALVYSIIDLNLNNGQGGVEPIIDPIHGSVLAQWKLIDPGRVADYHKDKYHIGVTKMQLNDKRYMFISGCATLKIFEIDQNGITEIHQGTFPLWGNQMLRSELEIYEDGDFIIVAIPQMSEVQNGTAIDYYGGVDIISFVAPQPNWGLVWEDYEQKLLSSPNDDVAAIKGVEFSPDGEFLYVTRVLKRDGSDQFVHPSSVVPTTDLIYFERNIAGLPKYDKIPFPYGSVQLNEEDFSFGMLEVDNNGSLILAGENRLGKLLDANNPNSNFNPNYISVQNTLTGHLPVGYDIRKMLRLLPDQVDGEDLLESYYTDQFPETLYVCQFPYEVCSDYVADWYFGYEDHAEPPSSVIVGLGIGLTAEVPHEGEVTVYYQNNNRCEVVEHFYIMQDPVAQYGADFSFSTSTSQGVMSINLTAMVTNGAAHSWVLNMDVGGTWVAIATSVAMHPVFTNLDPAKQYKVAHEIIPPLPFGCKYSPFSFQIIN